MQIFRRLRRVAALLPLLLPLAGMPLAHAARTQAANVMPLVSLATPGVTDAPVSVRGDMVLGNDGNFYFAGSAGGKSRGAIARMTPAGVLSVVYAFNDNSEGISPFGRLLVGADGDLYGTTYLGGERDAGVVFKVTTSGTFTVLHDFDVRNKGPALPYTGLVQAADGNLYGTTLIGGDNDKGTVYRIGTAGTLTVIHHFNGDDGQSPEGTLIVGADGQLYGTTLTGGSNNRGVIYRISTSGTFERLYSFPALGPFNSSGQATNSTGANPRAGLLLAADGNYYGTAYQGGAGGNGTVFRMTPAGVVTVVHAFAGASFGGGFPLAGLVQDSAGNLYGTTEQGGYLGTGSAYRLDPAGQFTLLHGFTGLSTDGFRPHAGFTLLNDVLYGVSNADAFAGAGAIFKLDLGTGGTLPIEFSISTTAITQGTAVTLDWVGPAGSTCAKVGTAWGNLTDTSAPAAGSVTTTPATAGLYTFVLSCTDTSSVARIAYAHVTVSAPPRETVDGGSSGGGAITLWPLLALLALLSRKYFKETVAKCP